MKGCVFLKKVFIIASIIIILIISNKEHKEIVIPKDSIRIRVIANSNSLEDQLLKLKVRDNITKYLYKDLENIKNISEARINIENNLDKVDNIVSNTLNSDKYEINYGNNYFPEKKLNGINYKEGNYESLVVNIGESQGNNWWCVLFPPLCMVEGTYKKSNKVEYKSKILEILNKY